MLKKIVLVFCFLVSGCVSQDTIEVTKEQRVITTNNKPAIVTKDPEVSTTDEVTQDESAVSDNQEPAVNRPVITLKYDKVMIDESDDIKLAEIERRRHRDSLEQFDKRQKNVIILTVFAKRL